MRRKLSLRVPHEMSPFWRILRSVAMNAFDSVVIFSQSIGQPLEVLVLTASRSRI